MCACTQAAPVVTADRETVENCSKSYPSGPSGMAYAAVFAVGSATRPADPLVLQYDVKLCSHERPDFGSTPHPDALTRVKVSSIVRNECRSGVLRPSLP